MTPSVRRLRAVGEAEIEQLTDLLIDCVEGGASVSFMLPLTRERAAAFWRRIRRARVAGGGLCSATVFYQELGGS